jgi:hypothetical protein
MLRGALQQQKNNKKSKPRARTNFLGGEAKGDYGVRRAAMIKSFV